LITACVELREIAVRLQTPFASRLIVHLQTVHNPYLVIPQAVKRQ